ncbi:hypothetical protein F0562_029267 [Nyssa sinensis]|uniref:BED-type domain-containing protein n=1 Tax=Nyssa sinensis TaxID=561372 RepID=A0A5J5B251_9ASTE|nr:hypothetical protein F0562_029267 [Nyssa sinensis]
MTSFRSNRRPDSKPYARSQDLSSKGKNVDLGPPEKKRKHDIGWSYGEQIGDNRQHVQCNFCHKIMKGGGVSRLKQHLAGGFSNVEKCDKCPSEVPKAMRKYLYRNKKENEEVTTQRAQLRENLIGASRRKYGMEMIHSDDSDNSDDELTIQERDEIEYAKQQSIRYIHMTEQGFRGRSYGLGPGPSTHSYKGGGFKNLMRSRSVKDAWDKFSRKLEKKKKKDLRIEEIDPAFYRNREVKQARLHHLWNPKKWAKLAKHAIAKYFIYENIPPSKAQAYYLNPAYHYEADVRVKDSLLGSLRVVISRLETNPNRASQALAEVKIFREAMYGFAERAAIRGRIRTDPESSRGRQATVTFSSDDYDDDDGGNNNNEEDSDSDDGTGGGSFGGSETKNWERQSPSRIVFTEEQGFTHATQDEDHGSRRVL